MVPLPLTLLMVLVALIAGYAWGAIDHMGGKR